MTTEHGFEFEERTQVTMSMLHPDVRRLHEAGWTILFAPDGKLTGTRTNVFNGLSAIDLPLIDCVALQNIFEKSGGDLCNFSWEV